MTGTVIIGMGSSDRGDDAAGLEAARLLAAVAPEGVRVVALPGRELALLDLWRDATRAVVIDAAVSGAPPGTVHRLDASAAPLRLHSPASTHQLGLARMIELGRVLGQLPDQLIVLGIEAAGWDPGTGLSPEVERGVREAVRMALAEAGTGRESPATRSRD